MIINARYKIHPGRHDEFFHEMTGIMVRALDTRSRQIVNADIAQLDTPSLRSWLNSTDAKEVVLLILGHR